jgi:tRNA (guanine26-N2/guanine27-N2)-dimethyltransferase
MKKLNDGRDYSGREDISDMLSLMEGEVGMPPYYYNVHALSKLHGRGTIPKMEAILSKLRGMGFRTVRTHFSPVSIKTAAPYGKIVEAMGWKS